MQNVLLSVIIPCYNSFCCMQEAFESLKSFDKNQSEIIVVDDCSTDNSYEELLKYADSSDMNIKVIRNEVNSGPGVARNNGISVSSGEYITFLDADDFFTDDYWGQIYPLLQKKYDCVIYDATIYYNSSKSEYLLKISDGSPEGNVRCEDTLVHISGGAWGKIYKHSIIQEHNIQFLPQMRCEDLPFVKCVISYCENIYYIKKSLYVYVQNDDSLTHNEEIATPLNGENAMEYMERNINKKYKTELEAIFIKLMLFSVLQNYAKLMTNSELKAYISKLMQNYPNCASNKYIIQYPKSVRTFLSFVFKKNIFAIKGYMWIKKLAKKAIAWYRR